MDHAQIINQLLCQGLRPEDSQAPPRYAPGEGPTLVIQGRAVCPPTSGEWLAGSPWSLEQGRLCREGAPVDAAVEVLPPAAFSTQSEPQGVPLGQIAQRHGADCLAVAVGPTCLFWPTPNRCSFCSIGPAREAGRDLEAKTPAQVALAASRAKDLDGVGHALLMAGAAAPAGGEVKHLIDCAAAIAEAAGLPVQAQLLPPPFPKDLKRLAEAGIASVGLNLDSFDPAVLGGIAPAKAGLGLERYMEAWSEAVQRFGPGQVSCTILAGLGEDRAQTLEGCRLLAELGVIPLLTPARPGGEMALAAPPDPEYMAGLYAEAAAMMRANGLSMGMAKAGCARCGACTALGAWELPALDLVVRPVRNPEELAAALALRHEVFVEEQAIVPDTDQDEQDQAALHLGAWRDGELAGVLRLVPEQESQGALRLGRLAVLPERRGGGVASALLARARDEALRRRAQGLTASAQIANVSLFVRLGWQKQGEPFTVHGWEHQEMILEL